MRVVPVTGEGHASRANQVSHSKATKTPGFLTPAGSKTTGDRGRPAQLYRKGPATLLNPPMLRTTNE